MLLLLLFNYLGGALLSIWNWVLYVSRGITGDQGEPTKPCGENKVDELVSYAVSPMGNINLTEKVIGVYCELTIKDLSDTHFGVYCAVVRFFLPLFCPLTTIFFLVFLVSVIYVC